MSKELLPEHSRASYVDLPAIIGGAFLALAISLVFVNFGSAIGLSITDPVYWDGEDAWSESAARGGIIAIGLWILWTQITASITGGYLTGRMRQPIAGTPNHEREIRDGAHGLFVWAIGTVSVAIAIGLSAALVALDPNLSPGEQTRDIRDAEHNAGIIFAFVTAASSFVSAAASWWAATLGGDHRDKAIDHSRYVSFQKPR